MIFLWAAILISFFVTHIEAKCCGRQRRCNPHRDHHRCCHDSPPPSKCDEDGLAPLILINGVLQQKYYVDGKNVHYPKSLKHCKDGDVDYHKLWVGSKLAGGLPQSACDLYLLGFDYDKKTGKFSNRKNVNIYNRDVKANEPFGSLAACECLAVDNVDSETCTKNAKAHTFESSLRKLVIFLEGQLGYEQGKNLFGACMDWRQAIASENLNSYYKQLKDLIESLVHKSRKPVNILAYGYGNSMLNHFLAHITDEDWQHEHINQTINVAPALPGIAPIMNAYIDPGVFDLILPKGSVDSRSKIDFFRSITPSLLPQPSVYNKSTVFIKIKGTGSYTVKDMDAFLTLVNATHIIRPYHAHDVKPQRHVDMHCIYGTGIPTGLTYEYHSLADVVAIKPPVKVINGDGDGLVNIEALRICKKWKNAAGPDDAKITVKEVPNIDHYTLINSDILFKYVKELLHH